MIFVILGLAFILRIINLNQSLWLDEAIGAIAVKDYSYSGIILDFLKADNHPPLYYLLLKFWTSLFGYSEISLRMPSVIFGILTIWVVYVIAKEFIDKKYAVLVSVFIATSPFHIYYSQEARMYSMAAFLASVSIYAFLKTLKSSNILYWLLFSLSLPLLMWTDYMPIFLLPVFPLYALIKIRNKTWWAKFVLSFIPLGILSFFWAPIFISQSESGKWLINFLPEWKKLAGGANVKQVSLVWMKFVLGRITLFNKKIYYLLVLLASVPFVVALLSAIRNKGKVLLFWLWFLIPLALGLVYSFIVPAFIYFRYLYIVPAFYLLAGFGIYTFKNKKLMTILTASILIFNMVGLGIYILDKNQQREQWRQVVDYVESLDSNQNVVVFEYPDAFAPYRWYQTGKIEYVGVLDSIRVDDKQKVSDSVVKLVKEKKNIVHFDYLKDLSDPENIVEKTLEESGYAIKTSTSFIGIGKVDIWSGY